MRLSQVVFIGLFTLVVFLCPGSAHAMHLADGILPIPWAAGWFLLAVPAVYWGLRTIRLRRTADPRSTLMVALVGAAIFIVSCVPVPIPWTGSCSHLCGTGIAALLIGAGPTIVVTSIALVFQALLLAHGGLTTLGADIVSMGVSGALAACLTFWLLRKARLPVFVAALAAGLISDLAIYATTALQVAIGQQGDGPLATMFLAFGAAFLPTQLPLGILEGVITALAYRFVLARRPEFLGIASAVSPVAESSA